MENENRTLRWFTASRNGKQKFVFLGRQTINVDQGLLCSKGDLCSYPYPELAAPSSPLASLKNQKKIGQKK
jgi:hypothetical protein